MEQNKLIEANKNKFSFSKLDPNVISDLRQSHFSLGHAKANYTSVSHTQFDDKSIKNNDNSNRFSNLGNSLRQQHYSLGDSKPDYKTETQIKFVAMEQKPEHMYK
jgi:hypothetical protein